MYYIQVEKGVSIFVSDLNPKGKKTVFLVHGWPINHKMYEYQITRLAERDFRCVAIDLRGFGDSSAPWTGYSYDSMATDILKVIKSMRLDNFTLAGFSMGGAIAIRYMALFGGYNVSKLALLSAAAPSFVQRPGFPYGQSVETVNNLIYGASVDRPQMLTDFGKIFFASPVTDSFREWFQSLGLAASGQGTIKTAFSIRDEDLRADLSKINVPTGIFHGKLDKICPYELGVELNKGIKNSKLFPFENSGHAIFYDQLEEFNKEFIAFLEG